MESTYYGKSSFKSNHLLIDHNINDFEYHSTQIDESGEKLFNFISDKKEIKIESYNGQKEIYNFLSSKFKVMEKMNLDDECCYEGKIEIRKIDIDKNIFPKSKYMKNTQNSISPKKK